MLIQEATTPKRNRQVRLKSRPNGIPQAEHFEIVESSVRELGVGQILVRNEYLSVEPAVRGWVSACPGAIAELYRGENLGKRLVRLRVAS